MTKSGKSVHKEIKAKIAHTEKEAEAVEKEVFGYEQRLTALTQERENCYATLATTYLPELEAESVRNTISQVQREVAGIFEKKQRRREQLDDLIRQANTDRGTLELELEEVNSRLDKKAEERDSIKKTITGELKESREYTNLDSQAQQSSARLEQNKSRVEEARREADTKLPAYNGNKLFSYLLKRGFGTAEYNENHGNVIKTLDSWVARIVNYHESKECYDFLKSMPELMAAEVEKRRQELEGIVKQMRTIEDAAGEKYGLPKVLSEGEQIGKKRAQVIDKISKKDSEHEEYSSERRDIDSSKDPYHIDAVQKLKSYLKGETISDLKTLARQTPGTEDDQLVTRIEEIDMEVRGLKDKTKKAKGNRDAYVEKLNGLKKIDRDFTSKDYDSDRSYFPDTFNVGDFLGGYLLGNYSSRQVWDNVENNQDFKQVVHHHTSSNYDYTPTPTISTPSIDWSGGGGFGGGGWSSGNGF